MAAYEYPSKPSPWKDGDTLTVTASYRDVYMTLPKGRYHFEVVGGNARNERGLGGSGARVTGRRTFVGFVCLRIRGGANGWDGAGASAGLVANGATPLFVAGGAGGNETIENASIVDASLSSDGKQGASTRARDGIWGQAGKSFSHGAVGGRGYGRYGVCGGGGGYTGGGAGALSLWDAPDDNGSAGYPGGGGGSYAVDDESVFSLRAPADMGDGYVIITAEAISRAPGAPEFITYGTPEAEQPLTIAYGASSDPDGDVVTYIVERLVDGGLPARIYTGEALSCVDIFPSSGESVVYRVKATDGSGTYSVYTTGKTATIYHNKPPSAVSGLTVIPADELVQPVTVSYCASTDPEGDLVTYVIERQVDGGAWTPVYAGVALSFDDAFPECTVLRYRVRAVDVNGHASAWKGSALLEIIPARADFCTVAIGGMDTPSGAVFAVETAPDKLELADLDARTEAPGGGAEILSNSDGRLRFRTHVSGTDASPAAVLLYRRKVPVKAHVTVRKES